MSLTGVRMCEDVWLTCLTHALSTETEEIMGLLLGDIQYSKNGSATALIWGASPQRRSDRRKDRVETNPEQLAAASAQADISFGYSMTLTTGRTTRVIGWYHSHPHITVLPSHVDVRTQGMYQMLDTGFIGLIFSCFNEDAQKTGRIQVIGFQSLDGKQKYMAGPVSVVPVNSSPVIEVDSSLSTSENVLPRSASGRPELSEHDTASSGTTKALDKAPNLEGFFSHADVSHPGRDKIRGGSYQADELQNAIIDIDPMDINESMQEAMHRSNMEVSGAEYVRKEIPLLVLPTSALLKLESPLTSFTDLQRVLYEEEKAAYKQAVSQNMQDGKVHPLAFIHHTSTYQTSMCKLMEYCLSPSISALQDRLRENEIRLKMLTEEAKALEIGDSSMMSSPRGSPSHGLRGNVAMGQRDLYPPVESIGVRSPSSIGSRSRRS
ncbi:hypothetical protein MKX01_018950 [Papaver californicum]|nr:hypothetical protein MKX01_018950 [Papaver californicum]